MEKKMLFRYREGGIEKTLYHDYEFIAPSDMIIRMNNGTYEKEEIKLISEICYNNCDFVVEFGGCLGIVSVITNKLLINPQNHIVIEANPELIPILEKNRQVNNAKFQIEHCLVSNKSDGSFYTFDKVIAGSAHRLSSYNETNKIKHTVPIKKVEYLPKNTSILIIDIEGGELELCTYILPILKNIRLILVEIHEFLMYKGFEKEVFDILEFHNFKKINNDGLTYLFEKI